MSVFHCQSCGANIPHINEDTVTCPYCGSVKKSTSSLSKIIKQSLPIAILKKIGILLQWFSSKIKNIFTGFSRKQKLIVKISIIVFIIMPGILYVASYFYKIPYVITWIDPSIHKETYRLKDPFENSYVAPVVGETTSNENTETEVEPEIEEEAAVAEEENSVDIPERSVTSAVNKLNVRKSPNIKSKILFQLLINNSVELVKEQTDLVFIDNIKSKWFKVRMNGSEGWVFGGYLYSNNSSVAPFSINTFIGTWIHSSNDAEFTLSKDGILEFKGWNIQSKGKWIYNNINNSFIFRIKNELEAWKTKFPNYNGTIHGVIRNGTATLLGQEFTKKELSN